MPPTASEPDSTELDATIELCDLQLKPECQAKKKGEGEVPKQEKRGREWTATKRFIMPVLPEMCHISHIHDEYICLLMFSYAVMHSSYI